MDTRTRRDKLAAMAAQHVSPHEAAIARKLLEATPARPSRTLSRDAILGAPDDRPPGASYRVYDRSRGVWYVIDEYDLAGFGGPGIGHISRVEGEDA